MDGSIRDVLWEVSYIKLVQLDNSEYCLIVEDTELNDFVEDFLWDDFEFQATSVEVQRETNITVYYNYFDSSVEIDKVREALKQLDLNEVERIYRLNN